MSLKWIKITVVSMAILFIGACTEPPKKKPVPSVSKKERIENNRKTVRVESDQIDKYIERRGFDMAETGSGLRYMIYDSTTTNLSSAAEEDTAVVRYSVSLIDGKTIYSSSGEKPAEFVVGHDDVESGLQEGIRYMKPGDKAIMIIPSHLAHGYAGDFNKIPRSSTVIFDIELLELR